MGRTFQVERIARTKVWRQKRAAMVTDILRSLTVEGGSGGGPAGCQSWNH